MHTSFTGTARKARQVNLSGRHVANPFASLAANTKPSSSLSGNSHTAVANAQAERVRRQQEKNREAAARKIQKTWWGHRSRQAQKQKWREEWDDRERDRQKADEDLPQHGPAWDINSPCTPYKSIAIIFQQMRLMAYFLDITDRTDAKRLLYIGDALRTAASQLLTTDLDQSQLRVLQKLSRLISGSIDNVASEYASSSENYIICMRLVQHGVLLISLIPDKTVEDSKLHFKALLHLLQAAGNEGQTRELTFDYVIKVLTASKDKEIQAYRSLVAIFLSDEQVSLSPALLTFLREPSQQRLLSQAMTSSLRSETDRGADTAQEVERYLWQLAYLVLIRGMASAEPSSFTDWIQAVSSLLNRSANDVAARIDELDAPMGNTTITSLTPLHPFVLKHISALAKQDNIEAIVRQLRKSGSQGDVTVSEMAKPLANYAIAVLRAFPSKASNIRMWLYRSSPSRAVGTLSTIQYLWQAARSTNVFQKISRDHRSVMSVLVEAAPQHNQIGRAGVSATEMTAWQEEWRIVLLFVELYSFILKIMDDEEFFALAEDVNFLSKSAGSTQFTRGALPLKDVASLTTFLKNLAFSLYWYAADLADTNEIEDMGGISALFGISTSHPERQVEKKQSQTLTGNGVSQAYLKGITTALLRLLHERDSRRKFLPENHWLMTSHLEMAGFIPQVVAEEQKRTELIEGGDSDDEEVDAGEEADGDTEALHSFTSMFGIRPPHMARPPTSRYNDSLIRSREKARKRRQAESLVPRLEILRNLPFFIPFDTRVQIFREFVFRDQVRRRNGMVDPDDWRVAVAHGTQARGLDGRARMDLIGRHHANIRRESVFRDAFDQYYELGEELKEPIQISFIDKFGTAEAGIDGGGVTKEFLMSVTSEAFDPHGEQPTLFVENDQRYLYPNPTIMEYYAESLRRDGYKQGDETYNKSIRDLLRSYEFLGRIVGKCMYEGILVDISFAGFFLLKWALTGGTTTATSETSYRASLNDFKEFDNQIYQSLLELKNWSGDVETDLGINFEVTDEMEMADGSKYQYSKDLMPDGKNVAVNNYNRLAYIDRITRYRLQQQPASVTNAFLKGLGQIIQPMWLAMFNQRELQKLVGGDNAELDINDLRRNTLYGGLYVIGDDGLDHPTVGLFWKVLREMNDVDRRKVLKFVTSTPRAPLLGFGHLNPKFSIRDSSEDQTRLPSTSTCVNLLKLPRYGDEGTMREKLLYAINSGAGFDLS